MAQFPQFDSKKQPRSKIELHVHLDGAVRITTIWELAQKKGYDLKVNTLQELYEVICIKCPTTLAGFLKPFPFFTPVFAGDPEALERIAYEFCEDSSDQNVLYTEVRYSPHLLASCSDPQFLEKPGLTPREVVHCINKGLARGSEKFNLKVRSILCCVRGHPEWSQEVLDFCVEFRNQGIVGIDIVGDESIGICAPSDVKVFQRAAELGIHRTVHAAEAGPASHVNFAIQKLSAERIGHGYHVVDDPEIYKQCLKRQIHFECCPYSSLLTGSVSVAVPKHPIVRFSEDDANFSLSRDDPTIIQKTLDCDYELLRSWGLKEVHFARANFNAAQSSFLTHEEKTELLQELRNIYGVN